MYFEENQVINIMDEMSEYFHNASIIAEMVHPIVVKMSQDEDTPTDPQFHWGIKNPSELEILCDGLKVDSVINTMDVLKKWEFLFKAVNCIPGFKKTYNMIVEMHFEK